MHEIGQEFWRNGEQINEFGRIEFWAFDHQQVQEVNVLLKHFFYIILTPCSVFYFRFLIFIFDISNTSQSSQEID
jgi:hypothetical protein